SDILHLRALIADRRGERKDAIAFYRRAIAKAGSALSPLSRVLELRNLAETLAHESPAEALTMYRHALETLRAHDLDPRLAPPLARLRPRADYPEKPTPMRWRRSTRC